MPQQAPETKLPEWPIQLPHQPPFRLLDKVLSVDLERGQLVAQRRLTAGDALWPAESSLPGLGSTPMPAAGDRFPEVLIIEALCQAAACLNSLSLAKLADASGDHLGYLVAISDFRFPAIENFAGAPDPGPGPGPAAARPAAIGETLILHVERQGSLGALCAFQARAEALAPDIAAKPREIAAGRLLFAVSPK